MSYAYGMKDIPLEQEQLKYTQNTTSFPVVGKGMGGLPKRVTVPPSPPVIVTQPVSSIIVDNNQTVTFTVVASGSGLSYQWQSSTSFSGPFSDINGETLSTLSFNVTPSNNQTYYRCIITNTSGSVTSIVSTLYVYFVGTIYLSLGGSTLNVTAQPDISTHLGSPIQISANPTPSSTVSIPSLGNISGTSWVWTGISTVYQLSIPVPLETLGVSQNGELLTVTASINRASGGVSTTNNSFTLSIPNRTVPAQFRWYAYTGTIASGANTPNATVNQGAATLYLASTLTGNVSNPRATSISIVSGTTPPGFSLVSVSDWNSGAASTGAFASQRVRITDPYIFTNTVGTYSFTLRVNWDDRSVSTPDFTDYSITLNIV